MGQDQKKSTKKKKASGIKKASKFHEKIKVPGTFNDLLKMGLNTKK